MDGDELIDLVLWLALVVVVGLAMLVLVGCGDHSFDDGAEPEPPPTPTPVMEEERCGEREAIGNTGFKWKARASAESQSPGTLVILFPSRFTEPFSEVLVNGEPGRFTGFANGNRQHWRWKRSGCGFGSATVRAFDSSGQVCVWEIPDGCRDWE